MKDAAGLLRTKVSNIVCASGSACDNVALGDVMSSVAVGASSEVNGPSSPLKPHRLRQFDYGEFVTTDQRHERCTRSSAEGLTSTSLPGAILKLTKVIASELVTRMNRFLRPILTSERETDRGERWPSG